MRLGGRRLNSVLLRVFVVGGAPLARSIGLDLGKASTAVVGVHVLDILEREGRNEARGLPGLGALAVELVDLLERKSLGLVDHGPDEEDANKAASTPDEEDLSTHVGVAGTVIDHVWGSVSNGKVEQPVGCCSHRERLGSDLEREDLTSNDPGNRSP